MALAYIRLGEQSPEGCEFLADLGTNEFFEYRIGRAASRDPSVWGGEEALDQVTHRSRLLRRAYAAHPFDSTFRFRVPLPLFTRTSRALQLVSYKDAARRGATYSRVISVTPQTSYFDESLPGIPGGSTARTQSGWAGSTSDGSAPTECRRTALSFDESVLSRPMWADLLLRAIESVAPKLIEALPALIDEIRDGGESSGSPHANGSDRTPAASNVDLDAIVALLNQLVQNAPSSRASDSAGSIAPAAPIPDESAPPAAPAELLSRTRRSTQASLLAFRRLAAAKSVRARRFAQLGNGRSRSLALDAGLLSGPLIGALIGPLLQNAPQLLGVLADKPLQFLGTLIQAERANDLQREAQTQAFIRALLAEVDRSMLLDQLGAGRPSTPPLASIESISPAHSRHPRATTMATRPAVRTRSPGPRESRQVVLVFDGGTTLEVEGKRKSVFVPNQGIALRANLRPLGAPPRTALPRAIVETSWVDTASQREVLRKRFQLRDIVPEVPIVLDYSPAEMAGVPRLRDLHVRATVRWPARDGAVGVRGDHAIYLTEGTMVASFGDAVGPPQPLDDVSLHRVFWNKIWEGGVPPDEDARRFELDVLCRYYVRAAAGEPSNGRMETRIQMVPSPSGSGTARINGRMRAGIEVSVRELARLAISVGHTTPLAPRDLATLEATDLRGVMDLEATTRLRVRGKKGSMGVVWAFPAVEPRAITLLDVARTDDAGQVIEIAQRTVQLPVPSQIHFVTLRSR